ncbi:MAG TPA: AMP-binding protein [Candidatus Limnocylindria bacterium]|nr:AMP-binding protein [Candidatus Limnocylindria bacterium]
MQVEDFLEHSARRRPDTTALICEGRRVTYAMLDRQANGLAHALLDAGVRRGDRVAVYLENSVEAVTALFAILKTNAVFVIINPTTKADKVAYLVNDCGAAALVSDDRRLASLAEGRAAFPDGLALVSAASAGEASHAPARRTIDLDLAALIYTSGSTGRPKGVMATHLNIVSAATSITTYLENTEDDVIINVLPLSFDYGLYQVLMAFKVGATLVLERSFTYPYAVIERIARERVTGFPIVPTISAILLKLDLGTCDFSSLRYITSTAAALPGEHIRRLRELFPAVAIYSMYGLTECKRVSYLPPAELDRRLTSVGRAIPNSEVYLVDTHDRRLGPGLVGELVVRGAHVTRGYWGQPEETDARFRPGGVEGERVLYTGDLFRMDDEGYLYFVGREDDIIKTRGEKVSPKEVEEVLYMIPEVVEAAVMGVSDPVLGEAIRAVVTLREGSRLTEQDVRRHCRQRLEDFMVPKYVEFADSLPKTPTGKIAKRSLAGLSGGRA